MCSLYHFIFDYLCRYALAVQTNDYKKHFLDSFDHRRFNEVAIDFLFMKNNS